MRIWWHIQSNFFKFSLYFHYDLVVDCHYWEYLKAKAAWSQQVHTQSTNI